MARGNAFKDWIHGRNQGAGAVPKAPKPKRPKIVMKGGGGGGGKKKNRNKNPLAPDSGGTGTAPESPHIAPSLPTLDAGIGLNAPNVGQITDSIYSHGFFDAQANNPYTPAAAAAAAGGGGGAAPSGPTGVQINPPATGVQITQSAGDDGGFKAWLRGQGINPNSLNPDRRARLREQYQATIPAPPTAPAPGGGGGGAGLSDTNDYENSQADADPAGAIRAMFNEAGLQFGDDAMGRYFSSQIPALVAAYEALKADEANSGMTIMDMIGNLGPVNYGQPGWAQAFNQFWRGRYNVAPQSIRDPYADPTRFEGPSRTLAFGV